MADARKTLVARLLALAFALVSVVLVAVTVEMMVVGPLGHPDAGLRLWLRLGEAYTVVWSIVLVCLYRFAPNVRHTWRDCLLRERRGVEAIEAALPAGGPAQEAELPAAEAELSPVAARRG